MIDTIVLHIHHIQNYKGIYEQFYTPIERKQTITHAYVEKETAELLEKEFIPRALYSNSGRFLPFAVRGDFNVPSFDYRVRYRFSFPTRGEVKMELEFSVPKYLYGTNVFQFVSHPPGNSEMLFLKLKGFIKQFFSTHFFQIPADIDIEIFRLDLCYNQFFNNKEDALAYLQAQKKRLASLDKDKDFDSFKPYKDSWMCVSKRYSFKCYHKGSEFQKHDYQQLVKRGSSGGTLKNNLSLGYDNSFSKKTPYNLQYLQEQADRILRYEITFRNSQINYLFHSRYFVNLDERPFFITDSPVYRTICAAFKRYTGFGSIRDARGNEIPALDYYINRSKGFFLKSAFNVHPVPALLESTEVTFEYGIFRSMYDFFWQKVKDIQIETISSVPEMVRRIMEYKDRQARLKAGRLAKRGGIDVGRLIVPAMLSQFLDLKHLRSVLPNGTYYRMVGDLKKAGIELKTADLTFFKPGLGYDEYQIFFAPLLKDAL